ncbi:hypothetical protein ABID29_000654 [Streptococcus rupicaprae]|uniref:BioF2-like acetyltransferase domain-containing protein n=1 Tax=Streptococcus rupicaprae TaxID=759619 RepID=A0ABV2FG48_9STRE
MLDIYFTREYGKVHESIESGSSEFWELDCEYGKIIYSFIKREIESDLDEIYYDLITPYGFGGPLIVEEKDREKLLLTFESEFSRYCRDNNIVSEFVRFHPIVNNAIDFKEIYHPIYMRKTVGTSTKAELDRPFEREFNSNSRRLARKAERLGLKTRITVNPSNIDDFLDLYYSTMDRNGASDFYYFEKSYFNHCQELFGNQVLIIEVIYENEVISAGYYFISNGVLHGHLLGTRSEYLKMNPVYLLERDLSDWAYENSIEVIHHGGGLTNADDDPLFLFKKNFTRQTLFDFYIAKKIHQPDIYEKLCQLKGVSVDELFFPAYRK